MDCQHCKLIQNFYQNETYLCGTHAGEFTTYLVKNHISAIQYRTVDLPKVQVKENEHIIFSIVSFLYTASSLEELMKSNSGTRYVVIGSKNVTLDDFYRSKIELKK